MKKMICLLIVMSLLMFSLVACGTKNDDKKDKTTEATTEKSTTYNSEDASAEGQDSTVTPNDIAEYPPADEIVSGKHHAEIDVKDYGVIKLELDADQAPITVTNFMLLAKSGFYNGLTFHRIMTGFMIQGGDPEGTGFGGSPNNIYGEYLINGWDKNTISHERGVISMARGAYDYNSASSQFFIVHQDSQFLDGQYAGFGHVTEGIEIVDKICEASHPTDDNGTIPAEEQPIINTVTIID